jgi:hypothetical protein
MRADIELPWAEFREQVLETGKWKWLHFDINDHYMIYAKQNDFTVLCKIYKDSGAAQTEFEETFMGAMQELKNRVVTEFELDDKILKLASAEGEFDGSGDCVLEIKVPGDFDPENPGRYIAGGYASIDQYGWGDRCTAVDIVDKDDIVGYGAGMVLETYHDDDVVEDHKGWRFYAAEGGTSEIEIEPIGGFGKILGSLYIRVTFKKKTGNPGTKVHVNLWWAEKA